MAAVFHHGADIVTRDFHEMSDEGVSKAMARPSVRLSIIKLGQTSSSEAGSRYRIVERRHCRSSEHECAAAEVRVSTERFRFSKSLSNAGADHSLDTLAERHVALILGLTRVEPDGALFPIKLIQLHPQHFIKTSASESKQHATKVRTHYHGIFRGGTSYAADYIVRDCVCKLRVLATPKVNSSPIWSNLMSFQRR